jgi:hypothetical protein
MQILGRKPFSSFGPPSVDHCLTGTGTHPYTKAVGPFAFKVAGLKSSFTHGILPDFDV